MPCTQLAAGTHTTSWPAQTPHCRGSSPSIAAMSASHSLWQRTKMQSDLCKRRWGQVAQSGSFPALHLKPASVSGCLQSAHRFFFSSQLSVLIPASFRKLGAMDSCICRQQHQVSNRDCSVNIRHELPDHVRPCFREVWGHKPRSMANYALSIRAP